MSATTRRIQQRAELKAMILDAAREVFIRDGYEQVSMRKLAEKIEYSPGTIYLHFKSKDELLASLVEESFAKLRDALERARREDAVETLRAGLHAYVDFGLRNPNHYHFAFLLRPRTVASSTYKPHRAFQFLREVVRCCVECGRFRNMDVDTAAQTLWAAVHGVTSLLVTRPQFPWVRRTELVAEVIDNSIRGLLADGRPEASASGAVPRGRRADRTQ
jgi:AcrR family transcriptional regulator